jgi:hypothetical protein
MFRNVLLAVVTCVAFAETAAARQVLTPERAIPDQYIVVFDDPQVPRTQVTGHAQALARQHGARILHLDEDGLRAASTHSGCSGRKSGREGLTPPRTARVVGSAVCADPATSRGSRR